MNLLNLRNLENFRNLVDFRNLVNYRNHDDKRQDFAHFPNNIPVFICLLPVTFWLFDSSS